MPTPAEETAELLLARGLTMAVAESSAGGYVAHLLTAVPGISRSFRGGVVAYGNAVKTKVLKVPPSVIEHEGAVSAQTALAMAAEVRALMDADIGVSETGIAGPGGGDPLKPVGTVYIAIVCRDGYQLAERCVWKGGRDAFKAQTADAVFNLALHYLHRESPKKAEPKTDGR